MVHPRFKSLPPFHTFVYLGEDGRGNNERDPLAGNIDEELGWVNMRLFARGVCVCECVCVCVCVHVC